jgi:hypothetical protein
LFGEGLHGVIAEGCDVSSSLAALSDTVTLFGEFSVTVLAGMEGDSSLSFATGANDRFGYDITMGDDERLEFEFVSLTNFLKSPRSRCSIV